MGGRRWGERSHCASSSSSYASHDRGNKDDRVIDGDNNNVLSPAIEIMVLDFLIVLYSSMEKQCRHCHGGICDREEGSRDHPPADAVALPSSL